MSINQSSSTNHNFFMELALKQANKNLGNTRENPSVGCIITKNKIVISAGCTSLSGRPHAEYNAIKCSKINLENSEIYTTLEPCSHFGKTPPCTSLILKKRIKKVFFSIKDPDLRSFNKSYSKLIKKNIIVKNGYLSKKIKNFYKSYIKYKDNKLPFVTLKLAVSKDFYTINKKSKWITNIFSRGRVQLMRSQHDCIITSSKTVIKDNPLLTCRILGLNYTSPHRVVLDTNLSIPIKSHLIKQAHKYKTIIFYNKKNLSKINILKKFKVKTFKVDLDSNGRLDLKKTLLLTKKLGYSRIFLEAGMNLSISFLENKLVDDIKLFISKKKLNKFGSNNIKKYNNFFIKNRIAKKEKVNLFGDQLITYSSQ